MFRKREIERERERDKERELVWNLSRASGQNIERIIFRVTDELAQSYQVFIVVKTKRIDDDHRVTMYNCTCGLCSKDKNYIHIDD